MRYALYIIFISLLVSCPSVVHAENETGYLPGIGILNREVIKKNREVQLTMLVDLSQLRIRTQHTLALTPVLVSGDGSREAVFFLFHYVFNVCSLPRSFPDLRC